MAQTSVPSVVAAKSQAAAGRRSQVRTAVASQREPEQQVIARASECDEAHPAANQDEAQQGAQPRENEGPSRRLE